MVFFGVLYLFVFFFLDFCFLCFVLLRFMSLLLGLEVSFLIVVLKFEVEVVWLKLRLVSFVWLVDKDIVWKFGCLVLYVDRWLILFFYKRKFVFFFVRIICNFCFWWWFLVFKMRMGIFVIVNFYWFWFFLIFLK